jgi:hypothetical protein
MVCNVVTYQARSGLRDLGKALAIPVETIEQIERKLDTHSIPTPPPTRSRHGWRPTSPFTLHNPPFTICFFCFVTSPAVRATSPSTAAA